MKKLLCFVLALAMIFGCLSMVTFVHAEGEEYAGVKIGNFTSSTAQNMFYFYNIYKDVEFDDTAESMTLTFKIHYSNPDSTNGVWYTLTPMANSAGAAVEGLVGETGSPEVLPGQEYEFTFTFPIAWVNPDFGFSINFGMRNGSIGAGEFVISSNANIILQEGKANYNGYWCMDPSACTVENLTAEQMPGYVAPTPSIEYVGVKFAFDGISPGESNTVRVRNIKTDALDNGNGTATISVTLYNVGDVVFWARLLVDVEDPYAHIGGTGSMQQFNPGGEGTLSFDFDSSYLAQENLSFYIQFSAMPDTIPTFIMTSNANVIPNEGEDTKFGPGGCWGNFTPVDETQMPGYVAPTEEPTPEPTPEATPVPAGVKVQLDTTKAGTGTNYLYFYNVANGVEINGDTASITFKAYNTAYDQTIWVYVDAWSESPWTIIGSETPAIQVDPATANEVTVTFPASYVNQNLMLRVRITSMTQISAGASFVFESNADIYMDANKNSNGLWLYECSGTGTNLSKEEMPVIATPTPEPTPTPTPEPTPVPVGVKVNVTTDINESNQIIQVKNDAGAIVDGTFVTDDVVTVKTVIYNPNDHEVTVNVQLMNGWNGIVCPEGQDNTWNLNVVIPANSKKTVTLSVSKEIAGYVWVEAIFIRYNLSAGFVAGDTIYFAIENALEPFFSSANWWTQFDESAGATSVPELPALDEAVEATPTPAPVGVKVEMLNIPNEIPEGRGELDLFHINNAITITDAMVADGVVTFKTTIYNDNDHEVTMQAQLLNGWAPFSPDSNTYTYIVIPANSKKTVTLTVDLAAEGVTKEQINVRYSIFANGQVGDVFYFEAENAGEGYYDTPNWWQYPGDEDNITTVTELPALEEAIINKIIGAQLQLGTSLSVIYYATVANDAINSGNDIILAVTRNEKTEYITGVYEGANTYKFVYSGINAQCMVDEITAVLLCGENMLCAHEGYSVKQYAINQYTNGANPALDKLLNDMLIYGREAQKTSGYMVLTELATDGVTWIQEQAAADFVAPTEVVVNMVEKNDDTNKAISAGLNISNVNRIYFKVNVTEDAVIKLYRNGEEITPSEIDGDKVYTDAIFATQFADVYTIKIFVGEEAVTVINYSVNNYIAAMAGNNRAGAISRALSNYGQSAIDYLATL